MTKPLSPAQLNGLYYFYLSGEVKKAPKGSEARTLARQKLTASRLSYPDPRPIAALADRGLIKVVGYNYGPLYGVTVEGEYALVNEGVLSVSAVMEMPE